MSFLTDLFYRGRRKPKHRQTPPKPRACNAETPELFPVHCVWKNRSSPHTRPVFQFEKNNFHSDEPQTTPSAPTTHRHTEARAKGRARPRIHSLLSPVETEEGEVENTGKLGLTEPGRVGQGRNGETRCGPNLQISENTAKLPVFTSSASHSHSRTRRALSCRFPHSIVSPGEVPFCSSNCLMPRAPARCCHVIFQGISNGHGSLFWASCLQMDPSRWKHNEQKCAFVLLLM